MSTREGLAPALQIDGVRAEQGATMDGQRAGGSCARGSSTASRCQSARLGEKTRERDATGEEDKGEERRRIGPAPGGENNLRGRRQDRNGWIFCLFFISSLFFLHNNPYIFVLSDLNLLSRYK
jgi:hypothetical protein